MSRAGPRMRRWAVLLAPACLAAACSGGAQRGAADLERMRRQQRYGPYEASALFSDGMAMRTPPEGTVAHEGREQTSAVTTGLEGGAPVARIPLAVTPELLAAGLHQFEIHCAVCHGRDGSGRSIMADNMPGGPPPSLLTPQVVSRPAGELFALISAGRGRMPALAWALPPTHRWAVIAYVRTLAPAAAGASTRSARAQHRGRTR